jgi:hypothetical protein
MVRCTGRTGRLLAVNAAVLLASALTALAVAPAPTSASRVSADQVVAPVPVAVRIASSAPPRTVHAKPKPTAKPKAAPHVRHVAPKPVRSTAAPVRVRRATTPSLTPQQRMMKAVARIPGYRTGSAVWAITPGLGNWGLAAMGANVVYISPTVPSNRMYDVVAHEWSHVLSAQVYGNDVSTALAAMNAYFGGSGLTGAERAADCMARQLGATWTHYTPCTDAHWRAGAKRLLSHQRL